MKTRLFSYPSLAALALTLLVSSVYAYSRTGHQAQFSTLSHNVSGTATILDEDTIQINNFNYDGGGPAVYFYLGETNTQEDFVAGLQIGPLLTGTVYTNDTLVIDVPGSNPLDGYNAISVWCEDVDVNFGSGTFGSVVEYEVTFDATWSAQTHTNFPPNPHFSGLIGATHDDGYVMWQSGQLATAGIENMAETGSKSPLNTEINTEILAGTAYSQISGGGISLSPGVVSKTFSAHSAHGTVSLVSMIAPSPDWFVGVAGLELYKDGKWRGEVVVELPPYDAGTDSGVDFTSPNADTNPAESISLITGFPFTGDPPLGTFTFRLICENPPIGDINGDCRVDLLDLVEISYNWLLDCNQNPSAVECQ